MRRPAAAPLSPTLCTLMGLLDFLKDAGQDLFKGKDGRQGDAVKDAVTAALGSHVSNLNATFDNGKVTLTGHADSKAAKEKAALVAGNIRGVSSVNDNGLTAPAAAPAAAGAASAHRRDALLHDQERRLALEDRQGDVRRRQRVQQDLRGQQGGHRRPRQDLPGPADPHPGLRPALTIPCRRACAPADLCVGRGALRVEHPRPGARPKTALPRCHTGGNLGASPPLCPMRRLLLVALLVLPVAAQAQRSRSFAEKGDVALVVGVSPVDFPRITPALGGIGVRYRATDRSVVGVSIGFDARTLDRDDSSEGLEHGRRADRRVEREPPRPGPRHRVALRRRRGDGGLRPPGVHPRRRSVRPRGLPRRPLDVEARQTRFSVGVGAILGAEVRVARGITLGAAYTLGVTVERLTVPRPIGRSSGPREQGRRSSLAGRA